MAFAKPLHFTSWSFSRWSAYDQCPLKAKLSAIDKVPEPKGPAMVRGSAIHDLASGYLTGKIPRLPAELKLFEKQFKAFRALAKKEPDRVVVEDTWAFADGWAPTRWDDWNGCRVRIKLDLAVLSGSVLEVWDWKTGKYRPDDVSDYLLQLDLYGLGGLLKFAPRVPDVVVRPRLAYLDHGVIHNSGLDGRTIEYRASDVPRQKAEWERRVAPMMNDRRFAPKPNRFCGFCHFRAANAVAGGGQCKY